MQGPHPVAPVILIVEGDQQVRRLQLHFLHEAGFAVEFVDDGEAAVERVRLSLPALVVTEILVPRLDGLSLCRRLREDPLTRDVPILVFSILAAEARAGEAGASAFLRKPLVDSLFVASVQDLVGAHPIGAREPLWTSR